MTNYRGLEIHPNTFSAAARLWSERGGDPVGGECGGEAALPGAVPADGHGQGRLRLGGGDQERLPADRTAAEHSRPHLVS